MAMMNTQLPLVEALKTKMRWHEARQSVLAENVSNADTPRFKARDLKAPDFSGLNGVMAGGRTGSLAMAAPVSVAATDPGHLQGREFSAADGFRDLGRKGDFEVRPSGNAVDLEAEMVKSSENQIDFQAATAFYQKSLDLIRTAIGKKS